jgi:hypothetical protein
MKVLFMKHTTQSYAYLSFLGLCLFGTLFVASVLAQTVAPSVTLSVDNRSSVQITAGATVTLRWEARNVSNCSINNGVGPLLPSELPVGSRVVTPPEGEQSSYTLTCQGVSSSVVIKVSPSINFFANPNPLTIQSGQTGSTRVTWQARNATACTEISSKPASGPRTVFNIPNRSTDGNHNFDITQNTTFTITCINELLNTRHTTDLTVVVNNGTLPDPRITEFSVTPNPASISAEFGAAEVRMRHNAVYATECRRQAFKMDGSEIVIGPWTNGSGRFFPYNTDLVIPETVRLVLRCGRPADNKWDTKELTVIVNPPANNQPVADPTAEIIAPDTVTIANGVSGSADVSVTQRSRGVTSCTYNAYDASNRPITLSGWTNQHRSTNLNTTQLLKIGSTVTLEMDCIRVIDGKKAQDRHTITASAVAGALQPIVRVTVEPVPNRNGIPHVRVEWTSENTSSCPARTQTLAGNSASFSGNFSTAGSEVVPIYGNTVFTVRCIQNGTRAEASNSVSVTLDASGQVGVIEASVTVDQNGGGGGGDDDEDGSGTTTPPTNPPPTNPPPTTPDTSTMNLEARPSIVRQGDSTTLVWTADPKLTCRLESSGMAVPGFNASRAGNKSSGSVTVTGVDAEKVYDLVCTGGTPSPRSVSTTVRILPVIQES